MSPEGAYLERRGLGDSQFSSYKGLQTRDALSQDAWRQQGEYRVPLPPCVGNLSFVLVSETAME